MFLLGKLTLYQLISEIPRQQPAWHTGVSPLQVTEACYAPHVVDTFCTQRAHFLLRAPRQDQILLRVLTKLIFLKTSKTLS